MPSRVTKSSQEKTMYKRLIPFLLAVQLALAGAVTTSYDAAGRLVGVDYGAGGSISYTYDKAGNVTSRTVQAGAPAAGTITSAQLVRSNEGEARIELRGSNLGAKEATFTIDGKPARVVSRCNAAAASPACKTDEISIEAPDRTSIWKMEILVTNGSTKSRPFWLHIEEPGKKP
jgi:YD repeat-containing protein